ncbi:hypothetical protein [Paenibacillus abyssi]|uniref:Uncharacterized protein n=1 Tax=Paenibacillus abyssi TaxID=1340531 RepID=A0A917CIY4_9BACL|nr:hypothetical protein [Paenibacillus abyssi]GGF87957.1 hypothetical protein GCM10010916_01590 [Paenibacillus abyssi]
MAENKRNFAADQRICDAATPGPWTIEGNNVDGPDTGYGELRVATLSDTARREQTENARFIAEARTGWPAALAEIERLKAELESYPHAVDHLINEMRSKHAAEIKRLKAEIEHLMRKSNVNLVGYRPHTIVIDEEVTAYEGPEGAD